MNDCVVDADGLEAADAAMPVVQLEHLRFRWRGDTADVLALDHLSVARGERLFIEGPSGSGKSTLLGLLAGVTVANAGRVRVLDQSLEQMSGAERDHFRADHIGYIFQMFNLIPYLGVVDNVTLPCRFSRRRRARALARNGDLATEARRLLGHLDMADPALLARPVAELSVGQQQRVAAARALMGSPEILIADGPTSSLDGHGAGREPLFDRTLRLAEANTALGAAV